MVVIKPIKKRFQFFFLIKEVSTNGNVSASKSSKESFEKILPISLNKPPSPPLEPNAVIIHKYFLKKK